MPVVTAKAPLSIFVNSFALCASLFWSNFVAWLIPAEVPPLRAWHTDSQLCSPRLLGYDVYVNVPKMADDCVFISLSVFLHLIIFLCLTESTHVRKLRHRHNKCRQMNEVSHLVVHSLTRPKRRRTHATLSPLCFCFARSIAAPEWN